METRFLLRACKRARISSARHFRHKSSTSTSKPLNQQANPIGDYYASILESSSSSTSHTSDPHTIATAAEEVLKDEPKPSIVFSSALSPQKRQAEIQRKSTLVAGIWVPPKPEEPDNCCMSGCVNCVWDRYGEEVEEWAAKRTEADVALRRAKGADGEKIAGSGVGAKETRAQNTSISMNDDGGGSETNWGTGLDSGFTSEDVLKDVPVGIREFMKSERRLREKHAQQGTKG